MGDEQESPVQALQGVRGVLLESYRLLRAHSRLLGALAGTLILPLCFMLLGHHLVSNPLVHKIRHNERFIAHHNPNSPASEAREEELDQEWAQLILFYAAYLLLVLGFSLLSTAAVVYSVACIYTHKIVSYSQVIGVVPRVWRRLLYTFLWAFAIIIIYHVLGIGIFVSVKTLISGMGIWFIVMILTLLAVALLVVHIYISCIWHLGSVISVLEDGYGITALRKGMELIKGKQLMAFTLFFTYMLAGGAIGILFHVFVLHHSHHYHGSRVLVLLLLGIALVFSLTFITLFGMIAQTVFYFTCKAYHSEEIDWPALSEYLGAYMGEYVPLMSSIQMEPFEIGEE